MLQIDVRSVRDNIEHSAPEWEITINILHVFFIVEESIRRYTCYMLRFNNSGLTSMVNNYYKDRHNLLEK